MDGWRRTAKVFPIRPAAPRQQRDGQRPKNPFWVSEKVNDPLSRRLRLLPPVNAGLLRAGARSVMLAVRTDEGLITEALAMVRQREIRIH